MKPLYKILMVILIVIIIGVGIYLAWQKIIGGGEEGMQPPTALEEDGQTGAESGEEKKIFIKKLSDRPVFDHWLTPAGEIYYLTAEGQIWSAKEGPDLEISKQEIGALNFIETSGNGEKVLVAFGDPRLPKWGIFDTLDKSWRPLAGNTLNASWLNDQNKLIAIVKNNAENNLVEIDLNQNPPLYKTVIRDFRLNDVLLTSAPNETLWFMERPSASYTGRVWQMDLKTLSFNLLFAGEAGLILDWSKDKSWLFKFSSPNQFFILSRSLNLLVEEAPLTFPSKCDSFKGKIYCFAPQENLSAARLPDDYLQSKFYSTDVLYEIDTGNPDALRVIFTSGSESRPPFDASNLEIIEERIYFINKYDNSVYEISGF